MDEVSLTDMGKKGAPDMYWTNWRGLIQTGYTKSPQYIPGKTVSRLINSWQIGGSSADQVEKIETRKTGSEL